MGIGILKASLGQSEKYRRGSRMSITPVSVLKMREAGCEKGFPLPFCTGFFQPLRHRGRFEVCEGQGGVLAQRYGMASGEFTN